MVLLVCRIVEEIFNEGNATAQAIKSEIYFCPKKTRHCRADARQNNNYSSSNQKNCHTILCGAFFGRSYSLC